MTDVAIAPPSQLEVQPEDAPGDASAIVRHIVWAPPEVRPYLAWLREHQAPIDVDNLITFETLHCEYAGCVRGWVSRRLPPRLIDDAIARVWAKVRRPMEFGLQPEAPRAWLRRIVRGVVADVLAAERYDVPFLDGPLSNRARVSYLAGQLQADQRRAIRKAIEATLTARQARVIVGLYLTGRKPGELARTLRLDVKQVGRIKIAALMRLRGWMEPMRDLLLTDSTARLVPRSARRRDSDEQDEWTARGPAAGQIAIADEAYRRKAGVPALFEGRDPRGAIDVRFSDS